MDRRIKHLDRPYVDPATGRVVPVEGTWTKEFELHWPVHEYEIHETPQGFLQVTFGRQRIWFQNGSSASRPLWRSVTTPRTHRWPKGGILVYKGLGEHADKSWRPELVKVYSPIEESEEILREVSRLDLRDREALLGFVNRWGRLGVGIPGEERFLFDGVQLTQKTLETLKYWAEWHYLHQRGQGEDLREEFGFAVSAALSHVHPAVRTTKTAFEPVYQLHSLKDALFLQLWIHATEGHRLRRCPSCRAIFYQTRRDKKYCSIHCRNRANVRRWRRKHPHSTR